MTDMEIVMSAATTLADELARVQAERDALIGAGCSPEQNALALLDLYAARTRDAETARDEANANYCFMVQRAADEKLDGYRELGARAAAAENERDALLYRVDSLTCALRCLLMSRDASWTGGHDWQEAVDDACKALGIDPGEDAE